MYYTILGLCGIFLFYKRQLIKKKYNDFYRLKKLVSTQHKNEMKQYMVCCSIIGKMWWMDFIQYINNSIEEKDKKTVVISYVLNNKMYKIVVKKPRGPEIVSKCLNGKLKNVKEKVKPYLGTQNKFHGSKLTPKFFGYNKLIFTLNNGIVKEFERNDVIIL